MVGAIIYTNLNSGLFPQFSCEGLVTALRGLMLLTMKSIYPQVMGLMAVYGQTLKGGSVGVDTLCIDFQ